MHSYTCILHSQVSTPKKKNYLKQTVMIQIKALKCENLALLYLQIKTTVNNMGMLSVCLCLASYEKNLKCVINVDNIRIFRYLGWLDRQVLLTAKNSNYRTQI